MLAWSASSDAQSGLSRYEARRAERAALVHGRPVVYRGAATSVVAGGRERHAEVAVSAAAAAGSGGWWWPDNERTTGTCRG